MSSSASNGTPAEKQKRWLLCEDDKQKQETWWGQGVATCRNMNNGQFEQQDWGRLENQSKGNEQEEFMKLASVPWFCHNYKTLSNLKI